MEPIRHFADAWMPLFGLHTLEVSAFILLVWAADHFLRLDTRLRYGLWLLALVKIFVPPVFLLPAPPPAPVALPDPVSVEPFASGPSPQVVEKPALFSLPLFFLGLWAASVLVMAFITLYQNLALRRQLRHSTTLTHPPEWEKGRKSKKAKGRKNLLPLSHSPTLPFAFSFSSTALSLQVFSCPAISTPTLVGFRRPRLYLPEGWAAWPESQLRGILAHELAHLRARDPYVLILQTLALILFGLNPLVWVMYTRLTHLRELRCDEAALAQTGIDPVDYSRLLYAFVESQVRRPRLAVTGTYFSENHHAILKRFQHILSFKEGIVKSRKWWHYLAPVLLGLAILPLSIQGVEQRSTAPDTAKVVRTRTISYGSYVGVGGPSKIDLIEGMVPIVIKPQSKYGPAKRVRTESGDSILVEWTPRVKSGMDRPKPTFPESAYKDTSACRVTLDLLIGEDGRVKQIKPIQGKEPFLQATIDYLNQTVWEPAMYQGKPISAWLSPPFSTCFLSPQQEAEMLKPKPDDYIPKPGEFIQVDEQPMPIKSPRPKYPEAMMKQGIEGEIWLQLLIGRDGKMLQTEMYKGDNRFKEAAVEAARESAWKPATRKGKPVAVWVMYPTNFTLAGSRAPLARPGRVLPESGDSITVDQLPVFIKQALPRYPEAALKARTEGVVSVKLLVRKDGKLSRMEAVSGPEVLHQAALDAVRGWSWTPAMDKGQPISVWMKVPVRFHLWKYKTEAGDTIAAQDFPRALRLPIPSYPEAALRDSLEGVIWLDILVGKDGQPKQTEVLQKGAPFKGEELFKQAALEAVKASYWEPFVYRGEPTAIWVTYPIKFTLH